MALRAVPALAAAYMTGTGVLILAGWATGLFAGISPATAPYVSTKANVAACFALAGISLWEQRKMVGPRLRGVAKICAALVATTGVLTIGEYLFGIDFGIDQLLFRDIPGTGPRPGRMAPLSAAGFSLMGGALVVGDIPRRRAIEAVQAVGAFVALVGLMGLFGYLYDLPLSHWRLSHAMALPSAVGFVAGGLGLLTLHPTRAFMSVVLSDSAGGVAARRLLPWALGVPPVVGWAVVAGGQASLYDFQLGIAWMVFATAFVFLIVVWANAYTLHRLDRSRHEAEARLSESEEQYRLLFDSNPHAMWVYDPGTFAFLAVNDAAVRRYGWSRDEFLQMTLKDIRPPESIPEFLHAVEESREDPTVRYKRRLFRHRTRDGTPLDVEISYSPITFQKRPARLVLAVDVTERKRLEEHLARAQKMEAVGLLAGGVAHDFNNLLGVMAGYSELLIRELPANSTAAHRAEEIQHAAERAAALTRQLLAFSRRQVLQPRVLDLNAVVADVEKMLRRLIGEDIQVITVLGEDAGRVRADAGQLEQVIVNLSINARDAMPSGGRLVIETGSVELDEAYVRTHPEARAGPHVMLAVSDTGHGMDAATLARIFEPFFTTKETGKGTGLGLATVYGIVRQSGGSINVYSEPGRGTVFRVYLPRVEAAADVVAAPVFVAPAGGSETILVLEDADALRLLIRELLEEAGYTILDATTPQHALEIAAAHGGAIQLLLTDVVLPQMTGPELANRLSALRPEMKVIFMSGYTDQALGEQRVLDPGVAYLQKPFTMDALLRKIREVLDAREQANSPSP